MNLAKSRATHPSPLSLPAASALWLAVCFTLAVVASAPAVVRLNTYNSWTFGSYGENPNLLEERLRILAQHDEVVISENAEWPNDVIGWSKFTPSSVKAVNPNAKVYRYYILLAKSSYDSDWNNPADTRRMNCPLTRYTIDANDWWLRDGNGNIVKSEDGIVWYLDVGKPGFKEAYTCECIIRNIGKGFDGFVLDMVEPDIHASWFAVPGGWFSSNPPPPHYPTSQSWFTNAWKPFLECLTTNLKSAGYSVIGNCAGEYGTSEPCRLWQRSIFDGVVYEQFALGWFGEWLSGDEVSRRIKSFSEDPLIAWAADFGLRFSDPLFWRKAQLALAMYYIAMPGLRPLEPKRSFHYYGNGAIFWDPLWGFDVGVPIGPARQPYFKDPGGPLTRKYFWIRYYSDGVALLNYNACAVESELAGVYRDITGAKYSWRIVVPEWTGVILKSL